jgi:N4-gp56 family major capsid protein
MRWVQFCDTDTNFGANAGDTLLFNKALNLDTEGGIIPENGPVPDTQGKILQSQVQIKIYGNAIPYTEYLMRLSKFDLKNLTQRRIVNDMAKVLNRAASAQFLSTKIKYTPTATAGSATWASNGTVATAAGRSPGVDDILNIVEALKSGVYGSSVASPVPPYDDDGNYICICSPGFATSLRKDDDFINASLYGDPERLFAGEIGRFHGVRFIEDNHILSNTLGTTAYKGEAVFFGSETVKRIVALPAEIREDIPTELGLRRRQGWLSMEGYKIIWEYGTTEPENRIVHVTST